MQRERQAAAVKSDIRLPHTKISFTLVFSRINI